MKNEKKEMKLIWVYVFFVLFFLLGIVVIGRILYLQYIDDDEGKKRRTVVQSVVVEADRGDVLADDHTILVSSNTRYEIAWDATIPADKLFDEGVDELAESLANLFKNKSKEQYLYELKTARKKEKQYHVIAKGLPYDKLIQIRKFPIFSKGRYGGGYREIRQDGGERTRFFADSPGRTLGNRYVDKQNEEKWLGLEETFDDYLKGVEGHQLQKLVGSNWYPIYDASEKRSKRGYDIVTSLNVKMQDVAESALRTGLTLHKAERGCVIVMDVETGFVKAIVNLERTDNGKYCEKVNDAVSMKFEPGSTFKLASILVLMEDGKIDLGRTMKLPFDVVSRGSSKKYGSNTMYDSHAIGNGIVSVQQVFEQSSNVGISMLVCEAYQNHPEKFIEGLYRMRLNEPLGLDIKGEVNPNIKKAKSKTWSKISLPWMSIGYELEMTPFQILALYNAVANNGKMVKPQFVSDIREGSKIIKTFEPIVLNEAIASPNTIEKAQGLLKGVVERGTAKRLRNNRYSIAGKTGTSQRSQGKGGYNKKEYNASFVGYFPAEKPVYSCIVVVVNPSGGTIYGGSVAAPIFKEISDKIYATDHKIVARNHKDTLVQKELVTVRGMANNKDVTKLYQWLNVPFTNQSEAESWSIVTSDAGRLIINQAKVEENKIPDVSGMAIKDAVFLLENLGLKVSVKGKGCVKTQSVAPGSEIKKGQLVELQMIAMK